MDAAYTLSPDRARQIGLIVLQADETLEADMRRLLPPEIEFLVSRVPSGRHVTSDSLAAMGSVLTRAASHFPAGAEFSAVAYGCTSGTAQIGADRIAELIRAGVRTPAVTEPVSALVAACRHLGASRIGLVSPYVRQVSDTLCRALSGAGIEVAHIANFSQSEEALVARISPNSVRQVASDPSLHDGCDAVFLSCTNLRTLGIIAEVEAAIGKPVLSSNQVLAWHLAQLAGFQLPDGAPGVIWS